MGSSTNMRLIKKTQVDMLSHGLNSSVKSLEQAKDAYQSAVAAVETSALESADTFSTTASITSLDNVSLSSANTEHSADNPLPDPPVYAWMFSDDAWSNFAARILPSRWSTSMPSHALITQLEEEMEQGRSRPVRLSVRANGQSQEFEFSSPQEAIDHIRDTNTVFLHCAAATNTPDMIAGSWRLSGEVRRCISDPEFGGGPMTADSSSLPSDDIIQIHDRRCICRLATVIFLTVILLTAGYVFAKWDDVLP